MRGKVFQILAFVLCLFPGIPFLIIYTKDWAKVRVPHWGNYINLIFPWLILLVLIFWLGNETFEKKWLILAWILAVFLFCGGIWLLLSAFEALNYWLLIAGDALIVTAIVATCFTIRAKKTKIKIKKRRGRRCLKIF